MIDIHQKLFMPQASTPKTLNCFGYIQRLKRDPAESKADAGKVVLVGGAPGMA